MLSVSADVRRAVMLMNEEIGFGDTERLLYIVDNAIGDFDFVGKRVLDIGCGRGLLSFAAAAAGAESVVSLEPEVEGSTAGVNILFERTKSRLGAHNVTLQRKTIQEYSFEAQPFDIILMHNCINHIDEPACETLQTDRSSRARYVETFSRLYENLTGSGWLMFADMSSRNLLGDLGLWNPLAKTIEWEKHQPPSVWFDVLAEAGFRRAGVKWTPIYSLRRFRSLVDNKIVSYLMTSHFVAWARKP